MAIILWTERFTSISMTAKPRSTKEECWVLRIKSKIRGECHIFPMHKIFLPSSPLVPYFYSKNYGGGGI